MDSNKVIWCSKCSKYHYEDLGCNSKELKEDEIHVLLDLPKGKTLIEKGIANIVLKLNKLGILTVGSCHGHIEHMEGFGWIQISNSMKDNIETTSKIKQVCEYIAEFSDIPILLLDPKVVPLDEINLKVYLSRKYVNEIKVVESKLNIILV